MSRAAIRRPGQGDASPARPPNEKDVRKEWWRQPLLWWLVLYFAATSRWGSYVSVPRTPLYVGDLVLLVAAAQTVRQLRSEHVRPAVLGRLVRRADLALQLCTVLLVWTVVRAAVGLPAMLTDPLVGLRDAAPYGYALAALVAFLVPVRADSRTKAAVYAVLSLHAAWILVGTDIPGWPWGLVLGNSVSIFSPRPDVDSALAGVAIGLTVHDVLLRERVPSARVLVGAAVFAVANGAVILSLQTRAGLLASVVAVGAVVAVWAIGGRGPSGGVTARHRAVVVGLALVLLGVVVTVSPPGHRLVEAARGQQSQALGTVQVRERAWTGVVEYITADAARTAVGVGFGPDFIQSSGRAYLLEGTEYADVRSPHNYLLGTFARLGVFGALVALLALVSGLVLGLRRLGDLDAPTVLAALLVLTLPTTAMLGVVLESPFGAIPYFWAVGHLARRQLDVRGAASGSRGSG